MSPENAEMGTSGNLGLICAFMGIAENARDIAVDIAKTRRKGERNTLIAERPSVQHIVGEMEVDLAMVRAACSRAGHVIDAYTSRYARGQGTIEDSLELQSEFQCAKYVANRKAIDVVDKALTISGGAGYMNKSPLARLYRDVRAGPFMQPYAPHEALEFIGRVALGQPPEPAR
jgi:alkylation response protein AidB-like acyl-CoA dehydrogenase